MCVWKMHRPFEFSTDSTFSYRDYLNRKGIELILSVKKDGHVEVIETNRGNPFKARSLRIKSRLTGVLSQYLSKNEAAIMQAVLLGDRYNIPSHIRNLFQLCGVSHILAISGLHLGIVAFLVFLFLKMIPMPRRIRYVLVIVLLVFYAFLTGSRPSVVRAMIMVGVFLASFIIERESEIYNTLSLAALMILLINPLHLFDVGFQLSFASVFSIIYFCPKWMHGFSGWDLKSRPGFIRYLAQSFVVSLAAFTGVAGLIAYYFHIITPIAVLANLVVIPLTSAAIALGMGLLFVGVALPAAAPLFAACLKLLLNLTAAGTFLFAQVPGAYFQVGNVPLWGVIIYYILLFLGMYWRFAKSVSKEIDKRAGV
jgi:competence protein ComEC